MNYDHPQHIKRWNDLGDFKNRDSHKSSILMVFSIITHPHSKLNPPHSKLVDSQLSLIWPWKSTTHGIPWSSAGILWISNPWTDQMGEWLIEKWN